MPVTIFLISMCESCLITGDFLQPERIYLPPHCSAQFQLWYHILPKNCTLLTPCLPFDTNFDKTFLRCGSKKFPTSVLSYLPGLDMRTHSSLFLFQSFLFCPQTNKPHLTWCVCVSLSYLKLSTWFADHSDAAPATWSSDWPNGPKKKSLKVTP